MLVGPLVADKLVVAQFVIDTLVVGPLVVELDLDILFGAGLNIGSEQVEVAVVQEPRIVADKRAEVVEQVEKQLPPDSPEPLDAIY